MNNWLWTQGPEAWQSYDAVSLRDQLRSMASLVSVQHLLQAQADARGVVSTVIRHAAEIHPCDTALVVLMEGQGGTDARMFGGPGAEPLGTPMRLGADEIEQVRAARGPLSIAIGGAGAAPSYLSPLSQAGMRSAIVVPLVVHQKMSGILALGCREPGELEPDRLPCLSVFAEAVAFALESVNRARAVGSAVHYDSLTGLPNRRGFFDRLQQILLAASRHGHLAAACCIGLDSFKRVNDSLGHLAGDQLLGEVTQRLVTILRQQDSVSRLIDDGGQGLEDLARDDPIAERISRIGGDEFGVLLYRIKHADDASLVASRIAQIFERPFEIDGQDVFLSASVGIAVHPADGSNADTLLQNADTAMRCAKKRGKNCFQYYTKSMNVEASSRLHIESRMRQAIEHREFEVWYQQQRDATSGALVGAEALIRWDAPDMGPVSPADFIPLAENAGCIGMIGEFVLRTVCSQLRDWQDRGIAPPRLSVNISAYQLRQPEFVERVRKILRETGVSAGGLKLEITETSIMDDDECVVQALEEFDAIGFELVLDDFGTGYSSLSYLRRFPIHGVKIDRSFVRELPTNRDDCALTQAIIAMAHGLGLGVVAEGVETEDQARYLQQNGCDELQGYLLGRPVPVDEFEALLLSEKGEDDQ